VFFAVTSSEYLYARQLVAAAACFSVFSPTWKRAKRRMLTVSFNAVFFSFSRTETR
jgi:hypothetical protein